MFRFIMLSMPWRRPNRPVTAFCFGALQRKRPVGGFCAAVELSEVPEISPELSPGISLELGDYGADGDHNG